ncbi:hypothetical protein ACFX2I_030773 [Malus domestica]
MSGKGRMLKNVKKFADFQYKIFTEKYGQQLIDIFEFPVKLVLSPFTLAFDIAGSAQRGFGVPELVSKLSYMSIFAVATLGTYDIALEMGKKVICQRNCGTCNGWQALRCTICRGSGRVQYQVKNYTLRSGEKATAECVADAIADNRAELVHLPSSINLDAPLPSKECPTCDGTGVMGCTECKDKLQVRISADDIIEPPWKAYNVLRKMDYPIEASINFFLCHLLLLLVGKYFIYSSQHERLWGDLTSMMMSRKKFGGNTSNLCGMINFVMWWPSENLAGSSGRKP